jgi:hypothetical protein
MPVGPSDCAGKAPPANTRRVTVTPPAHPPRRRWWRVALGVALLATTAVLIALTVALIASRAAVDTTGAGDPPYVLTDRTVKMRLLKQLQRPPQLLILGGSRATRFEPAYFEQLTGLRGFNLAFQNGRPEDAWAFVNFIHRRFPDTKLRVVWFIHVEAFRQQGLSLGLLQDKDLSRWFPASLIASERKKLPTAPAQLPTRRARDLALTEVGPDGAVLRNRYDLAEERGKPLSRAVDSSIKAALERYATTEAALYPRSQLYFERTLRLLSTMGTTQAVVLMPLHPRLLAAVRPAGWEERHHEVMTYLKEVQGRYGFGLLDCSDLATFKGDPGQFYDGFHVKQANARKLIRRVVEALPSAFASDGGTKP